MILFCFNRFIYFLSLFSSFYVSNVLSISSSSSFNECKLDGGKRFLSMCTCRTLTLGCRCPIINWPQEKLTVSAPYKRMSIRTVLPIDRWNASSNSPASLVTKGSSQIRGKGHSEFTMQEKKSKTSSEKAERKLAKKFVSEHLSFRSLRSFFWYSCWFVSVAFSFFSILSSSFSSF